MPPAARLGDLHICPFVTPVVPPVPHVGGPILPACAPTVQIGFMPAARVGDMALCTGAVAPIVMGSPTVLIMNMMAARLGNPTAHGGTISIGFPTVLIGNVGGGGSSGGGGAGGGSSSANPTVLQEFRGPGLERILVPVFTLAGPVANAFTSAAQSAAPLVQRFTDTPVGDAADAPRDAVPEDCPCMGL